MDSTLKEIKMTDHQNTRYFNTPHPKRKKDFKSLSSKKLFLTTLLANLANGLITAPAYGFEALDTENAVAIEDTVEIVVTAGRRPQQLADTLATTEIITRAEIQRRQSPDTFTLLKNINGLSLHRNGSRGSIAGVFLRGTRTAQTLILLDGVRLNAPGSGTPALDAIPVDSIERIEVVKGPMSSLYGADAMGGVIQIFTRTDRADRAERASANIGASAGSDATRKFAGNAHVGFERGSFSISAKEEQADGYDATGLDDLPGDLDPYEQTTATLSSTFYVSDGVRTQFSYLYSDSEVDFDNAQGETSRAFSETILENASTNIAAQLSDSLTLDISAGLIREDSETLVFNSQSAAEQRNAAIQLNYSHSQQFQWTSGVDYSHEEVVGSSYEASRENTGFYTQGAASLGKVDLSITGRADKNQVYGRNKSHGVGVGFWLSDTIRISANYGEAFRAPSFNELFFPNYGTPTLDPESAETTEVAIRKQRGQQQWYLTAYKSKFKDLIGTNFDTFTADNIDRATVGGGEVGFESALIAGAFLNISAAYTDARDDATDAFLDGRAQWTVFSELFWQTGPLSWGVDFEGVHGKRDRSTVLPSYGLIGAQVRYQIDPQLSVFADLDNIGDRDYETRLTFGGTPYQNPGRTVMVGFDIDL